MTAERALGEIDLRWGIFWKHLSYSLSNTYLIIKDTMRLHNFLVDFTNDSIEDVRADITQDFGYFVENSDDDGIVPDVILNHNIRPSGNITNDERMRRNSGIALRDKLKQSICNHNMH